MQPSRVEDHGSNRLRAQPGSATDDPGVGGRPVRGRRSSTSGLGNPTPGIGLLKTDGTTVQVWTLVKEGFVWNARRNEQSFEPLAESLNSLLGRAPSHTADPTALVAV